MLLCAAVRELSSVLAFCQFCDFLIYISVRFVYISVTHLFACFFPHPLAKNPRHAILACHLCHLRHLIDFKRFFLAKTLAKTCHTCHKNGKSLIFKGFFAAKCVMSLTYSVLS